MKVFELFFLAALAAAGGAFAQSPSAPRVPSEEPSDEQIFDPMQAEMDRSMKRLKLEDFGPPYYLSYRMFDEETYSFDFSYGSMLNYNRDVSRTVYVESRFGGPELDNTDLDYNGWHSHASTDPTVLRQDLWFLTDSAYKSSIAGYLDKKARLATELDRDKLADWAADKAYVSSIPSPKVDFDADALRREMEIASAELKRYSFIYDSDIYVMIRRARRYLLTSEGTRIASPAEHTPVLVFVNAWTRADDGMMLEDQRGWAVASSNDIPPVAQLKEEVKGLAEELKHIREAPLQAPFNAPAIMDPEFTGVFFHEALGHKLEGQRQRDPNESQVYRDQVGLRILPDFLSLVDDPSMAEFQGQPLNGYYKFDEEGVPSRPVTLVDHGILKNFLMSRWPIKGFSRSNGHGRADKYHHASGRMGNLMVVAHHPLPLVDLKKKLMELCRTQHKPYGFLLRGSYGGENPTNRRAAQTLEVRPRVVLRIDAQTGEETVVRGVKMVGTPLVVLNRIVAAGNDMTLSNPFNCGAESGSVPVDQISPSVLVSEVELQRVPEDRARPAVLPSPFNEKR